MKKIKYLSLFLCLTLMMQIVLLPVCATEVTQQTTETSEETVAQETELTFGSVCIQKGCRTINGMVPLGGSDKKLDTAQSVFLYEVNTGTVVYSYNADAKVHPGSLAKIVLAMIVLEKCNMEDVVTVTEGIQGYLPAGANTVQPEKLKSLEQMTVGDLLHAVLLLGANDAAVALAHHVAGTTDAFLTLMNNKVKQLGCTNTEFGNISGLYTMPSTSTGRDMAKIVQAAIKDEDFVEVFKAQKYTIPATNLYEKEREFKTTNYLIDDSTIQDFFDSRVTGGFQSFHEDTGASLVCTAENKGMKYIAVILGATRVIAENGWSVASYGNFNEMTDLLEYGFNSFKINRIIYDGMSLSQFTVAGGESNAVGQAIVDIDSIVPVSAQMDNLIMNFSIVDGGLSAPVAKDQLIATMQLEYRGCVMTEIEVYAMGAVKASDNTGVTIRSTATRSDSDASGFLSVLGTICVIVLGLVVAYLCFNAYMRSRMRARRRKRRAARRRSR